MMIPKRLKLLNIIQVSCSLCIKFRKALRDFQANDKFSPLRIISMINFYFLPSVLVSPLLGLVVDRFPNQSILAPRSHCDQCQHVWSLGSHPHCIATTPSFSLSLLSSDLPILVLPFWGLEWHALLACANGFFLCSASNTLLGAAVLSSMTFAYGMPFIHLVRLHAWYSFYPVVISMLVFFSLAIRAHFFFIGIGQEIFSY